MYFAFAALGLMLLTLAWQAQWGQDHISYHGGHVDIGGDGALKVFTSQFGNLRRLRRQNLNPDLEQLNKSISALRKQMRKEQVSLSYMLEVQRDLLKGYIPSKTAVIHAMEEMNWTITTTPGGHHIMDMQQLTSASSASGMPFFKWLFAASLLLSCIIGHCFCCFCSCSGDYNILSSQEHPKQQRKYQARQRKYEKRYWPKGKTCWHDSKEAKIFAEMDSKCVVKIEYKDAEIHDEDHGKDSVEDTETALLRPTLEKTSVKVWSLAEEKSAKPPGSWSNLRKSRVCEAEIVLKYQTYPYLIKMVTLYKNSMLLYPLIPLIAAPWTTCEAGMPIWAYVLYVPFLLATKIHEFSWLQVGYSKLKFFMGVVEHGDWFTDGAFPVQAFMCGKKATDMFAASLQESHIAWILAPVVVQIQFWGCAALLLSASAMTQQYVGSGDKATGTAAETCGMGALGAQLEDDDEDDDFYKDEEDDDIKKEAQKERWRTYVAKQVKDAAQRLATGVAKYLLENAFQLWFQSSLFAIIFDLLSTTAKYKMLIGMGLSIASLTYKFVEAVVCFVQAGGKREVGIAMIPAALSVLVAGVTVAKLIHAYTCESHMWNLAGGCVQDTRVA